MAKPRSGKGKTRTRRVKADKDDAVEMRKGDDLPLGEPVILDDADFDMHLRSLKGAIERQKTAKNLYDSVCKGAKKVSEELLTAIKRTVKFEGMDSADIKRQMEIDGYVLRRAGSPVQLTIHDTLLGDVKERAYSRGMDAGQNGQTLNNPYPPNSDLADEYAAGWRNGMAKNVTGGEAAIEAEEPGEFAEVDEGERREPESVAAE